MKSIFYAVSMAFLLTVPHAQANNIDGCFASSYGPDHLSKHKGQTLKAVSISIAEGEGAKYLNLMGCPVGETDCKKGQFSFSAISSEAELPGLHTKLSSQQKAFLKNNNAELFCAGFQADGDQDVGCLVVYRKSASTVALRPIIVPNYKSFGQRLKGNQVNLIRCDGKSSDGEGCEKGKLRVFKLDSRNPEDREYWLNETKCK